jgi:hypothetical protein
MNIPLFFLSANKNFMLHMAGYCTKEHATMNRNKEDPRRTEVFNIDPFKDPGAATAGMRTNKNPNKISLVLKT